MSAKEKAKDLVEKMLSKNPNIQDGISKIDTIQAKLCALIAVDEIINDCDASSPFETTRLAYWNEVKTEINNL